MISTYKIKLSKNHENNCYIYGIKRHWLRTYCTPKYFANLYEISIEEKKKI